MSTLIGIPPLELAKLWGELLECYHGVNGFGGDTAEIYAYRFMPFLPTVTLKRDSNDHFLVEAQYAAGRALRELVTLFATEYGVTAQIDRLSPDQWLTVAGRFDHRAHVRIVRGAA